jgi:hypothetical protein
METQTKVPTSTTERTARTPLGKKLLEVRQKILVSGRPLLDWDDIDSEIAQQRRRWGKEEAH